VTTQTTLATLAGELSTQNFSGEHPEIAFHWAAKIWNAALESAAHRLDMGQKWGDGGLASMVTIDSAADGIRSLKETT
jgi:hypothetical protein